MEGFQTVTLKKLEWSLQHKLSRITLDNFKPDVDVYIDQVTEDIAISVRDYIWKEDLLPVEVSWPSDWWQAFKDRWFPAWLKKRYPVQLDGRKFSFHICYPDYRPSLPHQISTVRVPVKSFTEEAFW